MSWQFRNLPAKHERMLTMADRCMYCGDVIVEHNFALGRSWMHDDGSFNGYEYCKRTVAAPVCGEEGQLAVCRLAAGHTGGHLGSLLGARDIGWHSPVSASSDARPGGES